MNIGAGRIIYQDLTRITKAIADGDFFKNKVLLSAIENCKKNDLICIFGDFFQTVEFTAISSIFTDFLSFARKRNFDRVYVHAFLDGRDTPPASGKDYIEQLLRQDEGNRCRKDCISFRTLLCKWTEITTGIVCRRLMIHSLRVKA